MKNQREQILSLLQKGNMISKMQFMVKYHIINPGARIEELRNHFGHPDIEKIMVKNAHSKRKFAVYFIRNCVKNIELILESYNK